MMQRLLKAGLGLLLMIAGVAMLVLPGPGLLVIALGSGLVLAQWPRGRRWLARLRVWLRGRYGSPRIRGVESRLPKEIFPPADTVDLRAIMDEARRPSTEREDPTDG